MHTVCRFWHYSSQEDRYAQFACVLLQPTLIEPRHKISIIAFEESNQHDHTGPSFNTGTENTIQVSKFKRIGFEKKNGGF